MTERQYPIPLVIGRPDDLSRETAQKQGKLSTPASFSRFVLPFAYQIQACQTQQQDSLCFQVNSQQNLSFVKRKKYLTRETGLTLYQRSLWLDMSEESWDITLWGKGEVNVQLRNRTFKLGMLPPRVVLFETGSHKTLADLTGTDSSGQCRGLLQTAFLCVDVFDTSLQKSRRPDITAVIGINLPVVPAIKA